LEFGMEWNCTSVLYGVFHRWLASDIIISIS
jgi:hypothetical protein